MHDNLPGSRYDCTSRNRIQMGDKCQCLQQCRQEHFETCQPEILLEWKLYLICLHLFYRNCVEQTNGHTNNGKFCDNRQLNRHTDEKNNDQNKINKSNPTLKNIYIN